MSPGKLGTINVNTAQLAPRLTRSLADYASGARGLFGDRYDAPPNAWGFRLYVDTVGQGVGQQDFFAGLTLAAGSDARRELNSAGRGSMDAMRQIAEKHRNLQAILAHSERSEQGAAALLGQISDLTRGLDPETAGQTMFELAHTYGKDGHWEYAAATFQLLTEKYPSHSLAAPALVWLVQYWSSGEALLRAHPPSEPRLHAVARPPHANSLIPSTIPPANQAIPSIAQTSGRSESPSSTTEPAGRGAKALEMGQALERIDAHAWSDLHVQFPLAMARARVAGRGAAADKFFATLANTRPQDAWWACAGRDVDFGRRRWRAAQSRGRGAQDGCQAAPRWRSGRRCLATGRALGAGQPAVGRRPVARHRDVGL